METGHPLSARLIASAKAALRLLLKIVLSIALFVSAGLLGGKVCPLLWPSLCDTVHAPNAEAFSGRYIPMPDTATYLREKFPGSQPWLDFKKDGTFAFNDLPPGFYATGGASPSRQEGKWKFGGIPGRAALLLSEKDGPPLYSSLHIKGQEAPYIIERWYGFPMQFCTDPQHSPANRALSTLSITEFTLQALLAFGVFVLPFLLRRESGTRTFGYLFLAIFVWGIWRMAFFDIVTHNDVPGMGYIFCALIYPLIASGLFTAKWAVRQWLAGREEIREKHPCR